MDKESLEKEILWTDQVRKFLNSAHPVEKPDSPYTIFKVPEHIRELNPKAYTPVVVSLGPFHPHNPYESSVMIDYKWQCVRHLLRRHGSRENATLDQLLDKCLLELKKRDKKVRSCYLGELPEWLDAKQMALIMLLDGCFIIFLMLREYKIFMQLIKEKGIEVEDAVGKLENKTSEEDEGKKRSECEIEILEEEVFLNIQEDGQLDHPTVPLPTFLLLRFDLLKLENQIPFFIIQLLFEQLIKTPNDVNIDLVDLALLLFIGLHPNVSGSFKKQSPSTYHHLLHLFYSSRIPSEMSTEPTPNEAELIRCNVEAWPSPAAGCVSIATEHIDSRCKKTVPASSPRTWASSPRWTPNATELYRAGVKFKRKESADSFLDITFAQRMKITPLSCLSNLCLMFESGRMEIPPLQIYSYTSHLFQNLMAFEQCYPETEMFITIYILFMDCIIDQAEDVQLLRLKGILEHKQKNDQEVAELFNKLGSLIHFRSATNYNNHITEVIERVNMFYELKWHKWLAGLGRDYLSSPWAIISVMAAIILLLLTMEQATFSALSYFHSS